MRRGYSSNQTRLGNLSGLETKLRPQPHCNLESCNRLAVKIITCARFMDFFDLVCFKKGSRCCFLSFDRSSFPIDALKRYKIPCYCPKYKASTFHYVVARHSRCAKCKQRPQEPKIFTQRKQLEMKIIFGQTKQKLQFGSCLLSFRRRAVHSSIFSM